MKLNIFEIVLVGISAFGWEDVIILAPNNQSRWLIFAKILLPLQI
jgi:hypothetical protein